MIFPLANPPNKQYDVFGFGTNAIDFLITVPRFPVLGSKVELSNYERGAGGEVASTLVGLQRLGITTSYAGTFGDDDAGVYGMRTLTDEGVDVTFSRTIGGAPTQIAFIVIDEESGERTVIWKRDPMLQYAANDAPIAAVSKCRILHLTPHDVETCIALAKEAKRVGVAVSLDIDDAIAGIDALLLLVDILIASSEFPVRMFGIADPETALSEMQSRYRASINAVTLGNRGSVVLSGGEFVHTEGFEVPGGCRDTTGAGDAFRSGFLYGLLRGETIRECARMANAVAALKCRAVGARTALPTNDELNSLLISS